jgi:ubiquinone/menaquinone biosynthesis C-methylase UbiE
MSGAEMFLTPAGAYDRYIGRYGPTLAGALIEFAGVERGMRALDVGCGTGALTAALADRLGAENVSGVDPSETFVEACRARLAGADIEIAGAEQLPFTDGAFDVVLSQLVLNFMSDTKQGVGEMKRVTRTGGTLAACVWDYAGEMTLLRAYWDAAREVEPERAADADEAVMRWCSPAELAELWSAAGLEDVRTAPLIARAAYDSFEDLWDPLPTGVGPAGAFCKSLDDVGRAALHNAFRRRLSVGEEPFELTARAWAVGGTRPGSAIY